MMKSVMRNIIKIVLVRKAFPETRNFRAGLYIIVDWMLFSSPERYAPYTARRTS
jgi:hypothetical protein